MNCIRCRDRVRYDRAVVRERDGRLLAGLCADCERERVGRVLRDGFVDAGTDCVFCSRAGVVALPMHRIEFSEVEGPTETRGFPVDADTPRLCSTHAECVLGRDPVASGADTSLDRPTAVADGGHDERYPDGERND